MTDHEYIDARQYPTIIDCSTAIDDAVAVDIVERAMKALLKAGFSAPERSRARHSLDQEFGLTGKGGT